MALPLIARTEVMLLNNKPRSQTPGLHRIGSSFGLTLLEVLIALLVLSIGLLGVAVLTVQSLQNTHSSLYTSIASAAALDFEERLWLDLGERASGCPNPDSAFLTSFEQHWRATTPNLGLPGLSVSLTTATVSPSNLSAPDLRQVILDLTWDEERFGGTTETFTYATRVLCRE